MSRVQYAATVVMKGPIQVNPHMFERSEQETRMASQMMRQDPVLSRTDALMAAGDLIDRLMTPGIKTCKSNL